MEDTEIIVSAPPYSGEEFLGSFAEFIIPRMKAMPKDHISQVDSATNKKITIREFLKMSIEIAEGLVQLGLKRGDVIVHGCHNHIKSHVAALGSMLSGGVFAPVDPNGKPFELQSLFQQFQPKFIFCEDDRATAFHMAARAVNLDPQIIITSNAVSEDFLNWGEAKAKVDIDNYTPKKVLDPKNDLLIINCSSGSTGLPKGVALSHYAIIAHQLLLESLNFDASVSDVVVTSPLFWISGSLTLVSSCSTVQTRCIPKSLQPDHILEGIQQFKPFFILLSPALLLNVVESPNLQNYDLSSLQLIVSAGTCLSPSIAKKVEGAFKGVPIIQMYGLTEVCGTVTTFASFEDSLTVGKLIPGTQMKVVDLTTGKSVGPNVVGECRLKTNKVMWGYYNRKEDTKETFDEDGWFKTGDLVYYNEEGFIYVVDRIKETIKYANYQVSPAELESYIIGLSGVADVAVVPVPHETDGNHIRALIVKDSKSDVTADFIIQSVKENFSNHKHLRGGVQFVDALPRSEIRKLKRAEAKKMVIL